MMHEIEDIQDGGSRPLTATSLSSDGSNSKGLTVHHLEKSQSERIVWLCEELKDVIPGFTYDLVIHERDPDTAQAPSILRSIYSLGTAPILVDETCIQPQVIAESQAIAEYLLQVYGHGQHFTISAWSPDYAQYLFWYCFANGTLQADMTKLGTIDLLVKSFNKMLRAKSQGVEVSDASKDLQSVAAKFRDRLERQFDMINCRLQAAKYLAGEEFTAADIMTVFSLTTMRGFFPVDLSGRKNILRYLQTIAQRPAYLRAMHMAEPGMKPMIETTIKPFNFAVFRE